MMYDYLIVGAGLFGSAFARAAMDNGKSVLVIDKRPHIAGNCYTENIEGITVHRYGAHIFHTNKRVVWNFVNRFSCFNRFTNAPIAVYRGDVYSLPFNMYTFNRMWGVVTPEEAKKAIEEQSKGLTHEPKNLEEKAISLVGVDVYEKIVKGYTEKQWGRPCDQLPPDIISRLPVRFSYNNDYFGSLYQGIPIEGYTVMVDRMLKGAHVVLNSDYLTQKEEFDKIAKKVVFTGAIDEYFGLALGALDYRCLRFETDVLKSENFQGNAVVNYTDKSVPFTRIIEHKWFTFGKDDEGNNIKDKTVITREYPCEWTVGEEPYYPINDEKNTRLYRAYAELAKKEKNVIFGGRLGEYRYYNMDDVISRALLLAKSEFGGS